MSRRGVLVQFSPAGLLLLCWMLALPVQAGLLLRDITLIDGLGNPPVEHRDLWIEDGFIKAVTDTGQPVPDGVELIDGRGLTVMPGLIDLHVHIGLAPTGIENWNPERIDNNLKALLYAGVTTVHDMGGQRDQIIPLRDAVNSGERVGPYIVSVGAMIHRLQSIERVFDLTSQKAKAEIAALLDERQRDGVEMIKLYTGLSPWSARHLMAEARKRGMRAVADFWCGNLSPDFLSVSWVDGFAHGACKRITAENARWFAENDKFAMMTLTIFDTMGGHRQRQEIETGAFLRDPLVVDVTGPEPVKNYHTHYRQIRTSFYEGGQSLYGAQHFGRLNQLLADNQYNAKLLHDSGALIGLGTDSPFPPGSWFGEATHWELELHVEAGIAPIDVIKMATSNNAKILKLDDQTGSIEPGKRADLLIVRGNPADNIRDTRQIEHVIQHGKQIDREALRYQ